MVECFLAKEDVAGSTPVSRSKKPFTAVHFNLEFQATTGRGTQVVRERSAKPLCVGSIPTRASNNILFRMSHLAGGFYSLCQNRVYSCSEAGMT